MLTEGLPAASVTVAIHQAAQVAATAATTIAAPPGTEFLGLRYQNQTIDGVKRCVADRPASASFAYIVTPNVDHVVRLHYLRSDLWPVYRHAWLTLCDSRILRLLAVRAGVSLSTVPGSDLTGALFREVIQPTDRIAILGSTAEAVEDLRRRFGLVDVVHYDPPMDFIKDETEVQTALEFLRRSGARYSLLAIGSPQQEIIAYRTEKLGVATGIGFCVGASIDFLTGKQKRAPRIMQRMSLEWLHRLASSPGRMWRRYLMDGPLILAIYRTWRARLTH